VRLVRRALRRRTTGPSSVGPRATVARLVPPGAFRVLLALALVLGACAEPPLAGTDLQKRQAPDFALIDGATGETVTLAAQRGKVVVLTFLYTSCPDVCPLTADKLRAARAQLGDESKDLVLIAVSVDPIHDTPEATREFVRAHRLEGALHYLVGDRASLARVWSAYGIGQEPDQDPYVGHTDAIFLIDRQGRGRTLVHSDVDEPALARSLRTLLGESRLF